MLQKSRNLPEVLQQVELADIYAEFAANLRYDALPDNLVAKMKALILDQLGVLIAGSSTDGVARLVDLVRSWGGAAQSTIAVYGGSVPVQHAAMVNSVMARARDFDSVHERAVLHVCAGCLPALLAAAERDGRTTGRDFIVASVVAMECMIRLVLCVRKSFFLTGRITSTHATNFATALGVARILGLDAKGMAAAMGVAACEVSGSMQPMVEGSELVRVQQGLVGQSAVVSALLAEAGVNSISGVFEGLRGYFASYHDNDYDRNVLLDGLGETFEIESISMKYYPVCFLMHSAIEGLLNLRARGCVDLDSVESIHVRVTSSTYNVTCAPIQTKRRPATTPQALFSMPFGVAVALRHGQVLPVNLMGGALVDAATLKVADLVTAAVDESLDREYPNGVAPSVIEVKVKDGTTYSERVEHVKGSPKHPMSLEECEQKLFDCVPLSARRITPESLRSIIQSIRNLEQCKDVGTLLRMISEIGAPGSDSR